MLPEVVTTTTPTSQIQSLDTHMEGVPQPKVLTTTTSTSQPVTTKPPSPPTLIPTISLPYHPPQITSYPKAAPAPTTTALAPFLVSGPSSNGSTGTVPASSNTTNMGNSSVLPFTGHANARERSSMLGAMICAGVLALL